MDPLFASDDYNDKTNELAISNVEDGLVDDKDKDVEHQNNDVEEIMYKKASNEENDNDGLSVEPKEPDKDESVESNSNDESDYLQQAKHTGKTFYDIKH